MLKITFSTFLFIFVFIFTIINVARADTKIGIKSFQIDPKNNVEISSQTMVFNSETGETSFSSDVKVVYGNLNLTAENLTILKSKEEDNFEFFASGPIKIFDENNIIIGDDASFISKQQQLEVKGNVILKQGNNKLLGDRLVLDLKTGIAKIIGSVKTSIIPRGNTIK